MRIPARPSPGALLLALTLLLPATVAAAVHANGDKVEVSGVVTDAQGQPLSDMRVILEASRSYFNLLRFERTSSDARRLSAVTNERGEYSLEWPWDKYYNTFELQVAMPVRKGQGERLEVLKRVDVTQRMTASPSVVAALVVERGQYVEKLRTFVAGVESADERTVYQEMGKPDEIKTVRYPDRTEVSWWYFESGRVYRFTDGALQQVVHFEPVKSF